MKAVILAAGIGSRLGEMTRNMTKGLVPVCGRKLIDYLLDFFDLDAFDEILIIGGHYYDDLKKHVDGKNIPQVRTVKNEQYLKGNIFTLIRGLEEFSDDSFLITNVDHIYPPILFERMRESFDFITAMCDFDRMLGDDDMKVKLRDDGKSVAAISKELTEFDCGYIGMTYIDRSVAEVYRNAIDVALSRYGDKAVAENVLQVLAESIDAAPRICDLTGIGWYEIDTEEDLMHAEKEILRNEYFR